MYHLSSRIERFEDEFSDRLSSEPKNNESVKKEVNEWAKSLALA